MSESEDSPSGQKVLGPLVSPAADFNEAIDFVDLTGVVELRCTYERDGVLLIGGLKFTTVRAYRFRAESHCTPWHFEESYDTLVEVMPSEWVAELHDAEASSEESLWTIRHFLVYVEDFGAYEVAAEAVEWIAERPVGRGRLTPLGG